MNDEPEDERTVYQPKIVPNTDDGEARSHPPQLPKEASQSPPPPPSPPLPATGAPEPSAQPISGASGSDEGGGGTDSQIAVGQVLNGIYRITRFLAKGGMGEVYEAINVHPPSERVAVKVMLKHLAQDDLVAAMFAKEAEMLTRLHHEAIVQYRLAARDAEGRPYIVTEFIDGLSLEDRLGELKLTDAQFAEIAQKLAAGLGTAHTLGAIHRDIAPDNILLAEGDPSRPKIIDFGIAKDARENTATIVGDGFAGKLRYVAPEQLGEYGRNVGPWSDIYSLALTLRAVASGKHSDMGGSPADAVRKRMSVPDLSDIPPAFRHAFEMALQPDPAQRPQSMAEFILLLDAGEKPAGKAGFAPIADEQVERTTIQPSPRTSQSLGARGASLLASLKGALPEGLAANRPLLIGGGVAAAVLMIVLVVVLVSLGGDEAAQDPRLADSGEAPAGEAAGSAPVEPGSDRFAQIASAALAQIDCSWLSFDGASGGAAQFRGAAGNPAEAQSLLASALQSAGASAAALDFSGVIRIEPDSCPAINALRAARSEQPLISTPQSTYQARNEAVEIRQNGKLETLVPDSVAKAPLTVQNIPPGHQIAIVSYTEQGGLSTFTPDRSETEAYIDIFLGDRTPGGFTVNFPAYPRDGKDRALIIISSPEKLPSTFVTKERFGEAWAREFLGQARAKGWTTDAVWFTIDEG